MSRRPGGSGRRAVWMIVTILVTVLLIPLAAIQYLRP